MVDPIKEKLLLKVSKSDFAGVFENLKKPKVKEVFNTEEQKELVLQASRYNTLAKQHREGIIITDFFNSEQTKIAKTLINLFKDNELTKDTAKAKNRKGDFEEIENVEDTLLTETNMNTISPIQSVSHPKEVLSKRKFDELMSPWTVLHWEKVDYGVDAIVAISQPIDGKEDRHMAAKYFSVQLKSSAAKPLRNGQRTIVVGVEKINFWYGSNLPTMVVYYDENVQLFYFRWINQELVTELNNRNSSWQNQKTITIRFTERLKLNLKSVEKYIYNWKAPTRKSLPAGLYFIVDKEIRHLIKNILNEAKKVSDIFLQFMTYEFKKNLSKSIYSIAIVGESRTGKSTLINAILKREVSPMGITKTTGAPIAIFPSHSEECEIIYQNGKKEKGKVEIDFIKKYASQTNNLRNKKKVQQINLKIINESLEKGIAVYDIPGLNDPNNNIRHLTTAVLHTIDAVIYVINGGTIEHGEFILSKKIISDLAWLSKEKDHVFIVINKVDRITEEKTFNALKKELKAELEHYELANLLSQPFIYLSAKDSFEENESGPFSENIESLTKQIWDYLLKNNKTGIQRLLGGLNNLADNINQAKDIHKTRVSNTLKRSELEVNLKAINQDIRVLKETVANKEKNLIVRIDKILSENCNSIITNLESQMRNLPLDSPLFTPKAIEDYLRTSAFNIVIHIQNTVDKELAQIGNFTYFRVQRILKYVVSKQEILPSQKEDAQLSLLINTYLNTSDSPNLFHLLFQSVGSLLNGILEAIQGLFIGQEDKRNNDIDKIKNQSYKKYCSVVNAIFKKMDNHIKNYVDEIIERSDTRVNLYSENLEKQIKQLNQPLLENEKNKLENYISYLDGVSLKIKTRMEMLEKFL